MSKPVPSDELCANGAKGKMCFMCCPACSEIYQNHDKTIDMTDQEIISNCKDEAASLRGYKDFTDLMIQSIYGAEHRANLSWAVDHAMKLAIQKARGCQ